MELRIANGDRGQNTDCLFVRDDGSPMNPDSLAGRLDQLPKRRGLPHAKPRAFRRTMASVLIDGGKDAVSVSRRPGHAEVSTTAGICGHIVKRADEQASECLADVMPRSVK